MLGRQKARLPARPQLPSPHSPSPVLLPSASPGPHPLRLRLAPTRSSPPPPHTSTVLPHTLFLTHSSSHVRVPASPRPLRYPRPRTPFAAPFPTLDSLQPPLSCTPPRPTFRLPPPPLSHASYSHSSPSLPHFAFPGPRKAPHFVNKHPAPSQTRPPRAVRGGCRRSHLTLQGQWVGRPQGLHLDAGAAPLMSHCSPQVTELGSEDIRACGLCSFQRSCALEGCTQGIGTGSHRPRAWRALGQSLEARACALSQALYRHFCFNPYHYSGR